MTDDPKWQGRRARLLLAWVAAFVMACSSEPERWTAFVYPPGQSTAAEDATKAIWGRFSTFEDCQAAAVGALRQRQALTQSAEFGDYECGVGCELNAGIGLYVCEETRK